MIRNWFNEFIKIQKKDYFKILLVFAFFTIIFTVIYLRSVKFVSLDDHFFHIRFAEIIRNEGLNAFKNFHWLYFSKISINQTYFVYYNFLFYLALIPLTFISPLFLGIKIYAILSISLCFTIIYTFLLKIKEKIPFFWVIFVFSIINYASIWRFLLARPYTLAPILLVALIYMLYRKKYGSVFIISFLYLYWHSVTFFFPSIVAIIYFLFYQMYSRKFELKIIISSFLGTACSLFILYLFAPGFHIFIYDIYIKMHYETIIGKTVSIAEGGELYAKDFFDVLRSNSILIALFTVAVVSEIFIYIAKKKKEIIHPFILINPQKQALKSTLFLLSLLFFLGIFFSSRNSDFFIIFSALYIVVSFNLIISYINFSNNIIKKAILTGFFIVISYLFVGNSIFIYESISNTSHHNAIEEAANWINKNTKPKEVIFNASWNWFPVLFYYNPDSYYIAGIEPRFLYDYDSKLYWKWWNITQYGYMCDQEICDQLNQKQQFYLRKDDRKETWYSQQGELIANAIKNEFKSRFIVTSKQMVRFNALMDNNSRFEKVYTDEIYNTYLVYRVN